MGRYTIIMAVALLLTRHGYAISNPRDTILSRAERYLRDITPLSDVHDMVSSLDENGQWSDINYADQNPSGWDASLHLQRLRSMCLVWSTPGIARYRDATLKNAIDLALAHWLEKRYKNPNWWHNQIGVPKLIQDVLVLLRNDLTAEQFVGCMEVMAQHRISGVGANLIWSADLGLHYGALSGDEAMIKKCSDLISNEIRITTEEGIQPDFSYHQHGARLQTFHYGAAYLRENIKLAWELRGTPWEFSKAKTDILLNFILEGWQWMARGIHTVPGTIDRAVTRVDALRGADIRNLLLYVEQLDPSRASLFRALGERQDGAGKPLSGFRHFPYSDFSAYHCDDFSFFAKTISERTLFSESINGENLKGRLLNSGDVYFIRDGNEYFNLMPVWNWEFLPGITSFRGATTQPGSFTGGVGNGNAGMVAMNQSAANGNRELSVKKFWAAHKNTVVCLQSDMVLKKIDSAYTVLDQCRWRGDVAVNSAAELLHSRRIGMTNVKWIFHAGLAYIPLTPSTVDLHLDTVAGSWSEINRSGSPERIEEKVFMPVLLHQSGEASGYVVAAAPSANAVHAIIRKPDWKILRNDSQCQAVVFRDGTLMAAFYSPSTVVWKRKKVAVDRPCLVLLSDGGLFVSDPVHKGGDLNVHLNGRAIQVTLPSDGRKTSVHLPAD